MALDALLAGTALQWILHLGNWLTLDESGDLAHFAGYGPYDYWRSGAAAIAVASVWAMVLWSPWNRTWPRLSRDWLRSTAARQAFLAGAIGLVVVFAMGAADVTAQGVIRAYFC